MGNKLTINDLIVQIESIRIQVQNLFSLHYMFREVEKIIRKNENLSNVGNRFFNWMIETYATTAGMYVRRQVDTRKDVVSFRKLLTDLSNQPLLISREYFVSRWSAPQGDSLHSQTKVDAENLFDDYVGVGKTHLEKGLIQADIKQLKDTCELVKTFADAYYAHNSAKPSSIAEHPKLSHLADCMKCLETLLEKYYLLINGDYLPTISNIEDTFTRDWRVIFTIPWIENDDATRI